MTYNIPLNPIKPTNSTEAQLNVCAVGSYALGQKLQKNDQKAYTSAAQLMGKPKRPSDHREGGSGLFEKRRKVTQPIEMTYVAINAVVERERIALNATVLPTLMREMMMVKPHVKITALTGICMVGWT